MLDPLGNKNYSSWLKKVKYKNWDFELFNYDSYGSYHTYRLAIRAPAVHRDTAWPRGYSPTIIQGQLISSNDFIPDQMNEEQFYNYIWSCINQLERHESEEYFTYNDVRVYDPHKI